MEDNEKLLGHRKFYDLPVSQVIPSENHCENSVTSETEGTGIKLPQQKASLLSFIDQNVIGKDKTFSGPYGLRKGIDLYMYKHKLIYILWVLSLYF